MDRLELAVQRAEQAEQLRANPLYAQAFADVRAALLETWAGLPDGNSEHARDLHRQVQLLKRLEKVIGIHIDSGILARKELEQRRKLFDFKRA